MLWGDISRKGRRLKTELPFLCPPGGNGKLTFFLSRRPLLRGSGRARTAGREWPASVARVVQGGRSSAQCERVGGSHPRRAHPRQAGGRGQQRPRRHPLVARTHTPKHCQQGEEGSSLTLHFI